MKSDELKNAVIETLNSLQERVFTRPHGLTSNEIKSKIDQSLPNDGIDFNLLLKDIEDKIFPYINPNTDASYAAYITGAGHRISVVAELIKAYFNQNSLKWNSSPIASELEQLVLQWTADFIKAPEFSKGVLTGSGSMSNFLAIHFALARHFPDREELGNPVNRNPIVYCSNESHSSVERAMVFLGLGRKRLRKIPVNNQYQIELAKLRMTIAEDQVKGDHPFMLLGNAGTTNTGCIDDLNSLADIAEEVGLWYHVDGAYGLPAVRVNDVSELFEGYKRADSITVNQHKWLYVNFEASCILMKKMPEAVTFSPSYLQDVEEGRWESSRQTVDLSKEFRALKIWMTFKFLGSEKIAEYILHDIDMTNYFAAALEKTGDFKVEPHHPLSILCFQVQIREKSDPQNEELTRALIKKLEKDSGVFLTGTRLKERSFVRAYFGNPQRTRQDVDSMVETIQRTLEACDRAD